MKRSREIVERESIDMAKYLMLLSQGGVLKLIETNTKTTSTRVFECKTCNRSFPSFQALGGHTASHKKLRSFEESTKEEETKSFVDVDDEKKNHVCSICCLRFSTGQGLGGHMRKHKGCFVGKTTSTSTTTTSSLSSSLQTSLPSSLQTSLPSSLPAVMLKRSNSCKRVLCLDLNLTPLENDLQLLLGKMVPRIS